MKHIELNELTHQKDMLIALHIKLVAIHKDSPNMTAIDACRDIENLLGKLAILDIDDSTKQERP